MPDPTPLDNPHAPADTSPADETMPDPAPPTRPARRTGVVFVHGIGTQPARETFLDWSEPIVRVLAALRREVARTAAAEGVEPIGENPVLEARATGDRVWARIEIPAVDGLPADEWVLTEAHWAGEVRAPGLAATLGYLRRHLGRVIDGIARGYGQREGRRAARLEKITEDALARGGAHAQELVDELLVAIAPQWRWIDWLDAVWQRRPVRWALGVFGTVVTGVALACYAPLRALPIPAIRDRAELAALNAWLVDWFGDIPVLLEDRVQAGMVRSRLEDTIRWVVEARGCTDVVLVAHSGGAIVSYATLLQFTDQAMPVRKLVTHGQGLSLGWRIAAGDGALPAGHPLRGDLGAARPDLRWVDFWSSYDPAPAGPFPDGGIDGCPLTVAPEVEPPAGSPIRVESRPVTNLMHLGLDHGGYWANDEGFVLPLVRHLDDPAGDGSGSRFYRDRATRAARIERRRRRVGVLLGWRWLAFATGALATLFAALGPGGLARIGEDVAAAIASVPGSDVLGGTIDSAGGAVALLLSVVGLGGLADLIGAAAPTLLGAAIPVVGTIAISRRGVTAWHAADEAERAKVRGEALGRASEPWAQAEALLLGGGLAALVLAAFLVLFAPFEAAAVVIGAVLVALAVGGLLVRAEVGRAHPA